MAKAMVTDARVHRTHGVASWAYIRKSAKIAFQHDHWIIPAQCSTQHMRRESSASMKAAAAVICILPYLAAEHKAEPTIDDDIAIKPAATS